MPKRCCRNKLTHVIATQQEQPRNNGLPPVLISLMIFVFMPTATIAQMIKNLLNSLIGLKTTALTPIDAAIVVIKEAAKKKRMKKGKTFENLNVEAVPLSFFA